MRTQRSKGATAIGMAFLFIVIGLSAPFAMAAKFKIDGGFVTLGEDKVIRLSQASGRYSNLGKNYYRTATIGCTAVRNISASGRSGQLSLEYWALPFFTSKTGTPLMSALLPSIKGGKKLSNVSKVGPAAYYNADGYIQLRLYEFSAGKWVLRASKLIGDLEPL
jgi:hypothetical protein